MNKRRAYYKTWNVTVSALPLETFKDTRMVQNVAVSLWALRYHGRFVSARTLAELLSEIWRDFEGTALNAEREPYELGDIDSLLGGALDLDFTWVRDLFKAALKEPTYRPCDRVCERLQFIELSIRIGGPAVWRDM